MHVQKIMDITLMRCLAGSALLLCAGMANAEMVVIVSAKSTIGQLSKNQVADIFLGKTARFPNGQQVMPIDQPEDSSARDAFYAKFTGKTPEQIKAHWSKIIFTGRGQPSKTVANGIEVREAVAENPGAISYIDRALVNASVRALAPQ